MVNVSSTHALEQKPKLIPVEAGEWRRVIYSFCFFAFLLAGYYVLRPVRDEMGIQGGLKNIQWLYTAVFFGMLILVPLYGQCASFLRRSVLVPAVYYVTIACLFVFYFAMIDGGFRDSLLNIDKRAVPIAFFIWVSIFNYFIVSVFWSYMADIWRNDQAKRLFAFIAAGGSIGAIIGPLLTQTFVKIIGIPNMLLVSAALFAMALVFVHLLVSDGGDSQSGHVKKDDAALGGTMIDGILFVAKNPYLLGICAYILCLATLATFFYVEQLRIIEATIKVSAERTQLFARLDLAVNILTLLLQFFVTSQLVARIGLGACLALLPVLGVISFVWIGVSPEIIAVTVSAVLRRATEFAIAKPSREILFTVVSREERYKAKNFIDTAVSRGGDTIATWLHTGLNSMATAGHTIASWVVPVSVVPLAIGLAGLGVWLGRKQEKLKALNERTS